MDHCKRLCGGGSNRTGQLSTDFSASAGEILREIGHGYGCKPDTEAAVHWEGEGVWEDEFFQADFFLCQLADLVSLLSLLLL